MNSLLTGNVSLIALATGSIATAVDMVKSNNYIGAGILLVIAVLAFIGYEKLPATTPNTTGNTLPTTTDVTPVVVVPTVSVPVSTPIMTTTATTSVPPSPTPPVIVTPTAP